MMDFNERVIPGVTANFQFKESLARYEFAKRIFMQSRFCYFRKHHGLLSALVVELFARFSKWHLLFILVVLIGFLLYFLK